MKNILVAVDLKSTDAELINHASAMAEKFNSKIWIIHIAAPAPDFVGYRVGPTYIREMRAEELRKEHKELQTLATQLKEASIEAEALLIQGPTIDMLKKEVENLKIDLLIMGSHKRGFLFEMLVGPTSSVKAIKEIPIPIFIIPLPDWE
jgi:nucleotide-binding universal stress UspA family protein